MQSKMHPKYYLSQEIFEREQKKIFRKLWIFAGIKTLLTKHNSFITRKIAGIPIVIQNFHGELRAFENICLHRSALLQTETVGRRPLVCAYHAWRFDAKGKVESLPGCESIYQFSELEKNNLKLREYSLKTVGNILFINLSPTPFPLEDQFSSEFIELLKSSSEAYDTEVLVSTWHSNFNWKLAFENLRDANHPRFVHPKTLAKVVNFTPSVNDALNQESKEPLKNFSPEGLRKEIKRFSYGGADAEIPNMRHFSWHQMVERWGNKDLYYNWLAYPNLHIASANGGHSFTIEYYIPISPEKTDIEVYRFSARKKIPYAFSSQVLLAEMHGSKSVVGEDIDIMESVQAALHHDAPIPEQGAYESINRLVERWYTTLMETSHEI